MTIGGIKLERVGNILYRICRAAIILTVLYGWWQAYWAGENKMVIFMLFAGPAILAWVVLRGIRFVLLRGDARRPSSGTKADGRA